MEGSAPRITRGLRQHPGADGDQKINTNNFSHISTKTCGCLSATISTEIGFDKEFPISLKSNSVLVFSKDMCVDEALVRQAFEHLEIMKLKSKKKKNTVS